MSLFIVLACVFKKFIFNSILALLQLLLLIIIFPLQNTTWSKISLKINFFNLVFESIWRNILLLGVIFWVGFIFKLKLTFIFDLRFSNYTFDTKNFKFKIFFNNLFSLLWNLNSILRKWFSFQKFLFFFCFFFMWMDINLESNDLIIFNGDFWCCD